MTLKIKKASTATAPKPKKITPAPHEEKSYADQIMDKAGDNVTHYLQRTKEIEALKAMMKNLEQERAPHEKAIRAAIDEVLINDDDARVGLICDAGTLEIGVPAKSRHIEDKEAIFNLLEGVKEGLVFELATIPMGELDKYLSRDEMAPYMAFKYSRRPIKAK